MEVFVPGILLLTIIIIAFVVLVTSKQSRAVVNNAISDAAGDLGLKYRGGFSFSQSSASGVIDGLKVTIRPYTDTENRSGFSDLIRIYITHRINAGGILRMTLENEFSFPLLANNLKGEDIQVGDAGLDRTFQIKGSSPLHVAALMNERMRKIILSLVGRSQMLVLTSTWFEIVLKYNGLKKEEIVVIARDALDVSRDMSREDDVRIRLMEIIRNDSAPGVRASCIRHLMSHFPVDHEITDLLEGALKDTDLSVRIEAARHLGFEGLELLANMLKEDKGMGNEDAVRIIRFMGEHRFAGGIPVLKDIFTSGKDEIVLVEILKAFAAIGDTGLCSFLLTHLEHRNGDIREGVISALTTCGTVDAVEPLMKMAKSSINPLFRGDVQKTIASIQSRLGGADAGWLSVTETGGTDGALSMSRGVGEGALSRDKKERG